jgi:hypothetical protein
MHDANTLVKKAIELLKAKQKSKARELLMQAVDLDEGHEEGWLYLSLVVDSKNEQKICLENVLAINPNNEQARKALSVVRQKLGEPDPPPTGAPPPVASPKQDPGWGDLDVEATWSAISGGERTVPVPPKSSPVADSTDWFGDAPWGSVSGDPASTGESMDLSGPTVDPDRPATSVEWAKKPAADTGGYHGSGKQVDPLSKTELDNWVAGLNLQNNRVPAPTGIGAGETDDWDTTDSIMSESPYGTPPTSTSPFTTFDFDAPLPTKESTAPPAIAPPRTHRSSPLPPSIMSPQDADEFTIHDDPFGDTTSNLPVDDSFFNIDSLDGGLAVRPKPKIAGMEFFIQIPEDIQAPIEEPRKSGGAFVVVMLLILNLLALGGLIFNMMG